MEELTYSLKFAILLVALFGSSTKGFSDDDYFDTTTKDFENSTDYTEVPFEESTEIPLTDEQYREYVNNLKCDELFGHHDGIKVDEVETGTIYKYQQSTIAPTLENEQSGGSISVDAISRTRNTTTKWWSPALGVVANDARLMHARISSEPGLSSVGQIPHQQEGSLRDQEDSSSHPRSSNDSIRHGTYGKGDNTTDQGELVRETSDGAPEDSARIVPGVEPFRGDEYETDHGTMDKECTAPLSSDWTNYNWYQILLDNGGSPGMFLKPGLAGKLQRVDNPCIRPLTLITDSDYKGDLTFTYAVYAKVFRQEKVSVRLAGTSKEFLDIQGDLLWAPPKATRYYQLMYRKDDSGLYVRLLLDRSCELIQSQNSFSGDIELQAKCRWHPDKVCDCVNGREFCRTVAYYPTPATSRPLPKPLKCGLVGGYGKCNKK